MSYQNVIYQKDGRIATIILNRPEKLNALSEALQREFDQALDEARGDDEVRVVIVKGAGRAFSAGYDIAPTTPERATRATQFRDRERLQAVLERWLRVWEFPKPVIAQVHGYCLAGGTQLAMLCDVTLVAEDARIGMPSLPIGGGFISPMWCWLIGPKRAKEMTFQAGSWISGKEAELWGWANRAFPADQLEQRTLEMAHRIAKLHPEVLRIKKLAVNRVMDIQGFRTSVLSGAEWDAFLHYTEPVEHMADMIKEKGIRGTIEWFDSEA